MQLEAAARAVIVVAFALSESVKGQQGAFSGGIQYNTPVCQSICQDPNEFETPLPQQPAGELNRAHDWGIVLLNQIQRNFARLSPPGVSRIIGVFSSCVHDTVAAQGNAGIQPGFSRTQPFTP
ncbi:unnamed protein product, partial [Ostreobium quekettii]